MHSQRRNLTFHFCSVVFCRQLRILCRALSSTAATPTPPSNSARFHLKSKVSCVREKRHRTGGPLDHDALQVRPPGPTINFTFNVDTQHPSSNASFHHHCPTCPLEPHSLNVRRACCSASTTSSSYIEFGRDCDYLYVPLSFLSFALQPYMSPTAKPQPLIMHDY